MSVMKNQLKIFTFVIRFSVHGDQFELRGQISRRRKDLITWYRKIQTQSTNSYCVIIYDIPSST